MESKNRTAFNRSFLDEVPVVGILRGIAYGDVVRILPLCKASGIRNIEITMNSMDVGKSMAHALENYGDSMNIGAGTVCNMKDLGLALDQGASFIVAPNLNVEVVRECVRLGVPIFPGALTPTEIHRAWDLGATMVKVFPIDTLGAKYIKNIRAPFDDIKLLPTGGIDATNVQGYFKAGASGIGVSGGLFDKEMVRNKNWKALENHIMSFMSRIP